MEKLQHKWTTMVETPFWGVRTSPQVLCTGLHLLQFIESSNICKGLPQDEESNSVVADPTWEDEITEFSQSTVFHHSVPRLPCESHFKTSVTFWSQNCTVFDCTTQATTEKEQYKPCSKAHKLKKSATRKMTVSSVPAKSKASLSACGPDKLRATVKATRLECKQLEDRVKELETRINEDGVSISETLEKNILKIIGGFRRFDWLCGSWGSNDKLCMSWG